MCRLCEKLKGVGSVPMGQQVVGSVPTDGVVARGTRKVRRDGDVPKRDSAVVEDSVHTAVVALVRCVLAVAVAAGADTTYTRREQ